MLSIPKRLIEVDLPIRRISAHARREKSIRHGHISTLHIWWARRPLAACRAVLCAALWPDPADDHCPPSFRTAAVQAVTEFAQRIVPSEKLILRCDAESRPRWQELGWGRRALDAGIAADLEALRGLLLDFIADFANWDNSSVPVFLETARALTQAAHEALGGEPGTRPLVADPFAGGGSIPLEALRIGADAFASDLNPVAVLLNKVVLEYIPKYGKTLADEVRKWGKWVKEQAEKELAVFYPADADGATPIAYLWARTVVCEGPGCGAEVPLIRSQWLAKKGSKSVALRLVPNLEAKRVDFEIIHDAAAKEVASGTVKRGSATCPCCGYTTPVKSVREQLKKRRGGAADARLYCVVTIKPNASGRCYRLPTDEDLAAVKNAATELEKRQAADTDELSLIPNEKISLNEIRRISTLIYGMATWGDHFSPRQALALATFCRFVNEAGECLAKETSHQARLAVQTCLAFGLSRLADRSSSVCRWDPTPTASGVINTFSRQAIPMMWDFAEGVPLEQKSGGWLPSLEWIALVAGTDRSSELATGTVEQASATQHPLPDGALNAVVTDPPYYDAVPYAHLSDFFYVWLRRSLKHCAHEILNGLQVPKEQEIVVDRPHELSDSLKTVEFYERELARAFGEACRILQPNGVGVVVFASKTTSSWEAILQAVVSSGWTITGSWPIDTEMTNRVAAQEQARLASSVHLVCRPRAGNAVGDWRDVLAELPVRIHQWMPRLAQEGVVGADAIFACLGPALEIYSRYARVEKTNGDPVPLREYLEQVWSAVAREALVMILNGADASGFEEDARLSVIWFWVIKSATGDSTAPRADDESEGEADDSDAEEESGKAVKVNGWQMEYDAVRKLAMGLGADLNKLSKPGGIVVVTGKVAVLRAVNGRQGALLGVQRAAEAPEAEPRKSVQLNLFGDPVEQKKPKRKRREAATEALVTARPVAERKSTLTDETDEPLTGLFAGIKDRRSLIERMVESGVTVLDRLHQAMLLFGQSQTALLGPFLEAAHMGSDPRFWRLAQALSALYPLGTEEKRWVDGLLGRKKTLGF